MTLFSTIYLTTWGVIIICMPYIISNTPLYKYRICIISFTGITIGFIQTTYNVLESAGEVNLLVGLLNGNLDKNVQVRLYTEDGSATGM